MSTTQAAMEQQQQAAARMPAVENKISMVVFSGDLDKLLASLIIATGAVAMGMKVKLFFTFWVHASLLVHACLVAVDGSPPADPAACPHPDYSF